MKTSRRDFLAQAAGLPLVLGLPLAGCHRHPAPAWLEGALGRLRSEDRPGMLSQITTALFNEQANIHSLETRPGDGRSTEGAMVDVTLEVKDKRQLERVVSAIRRISGIRDIERVNERN